MEHRDHIFVKGNGSLSLVKNISTNLSRKYSKKCLDLAKISVTDPIKTTLKKLILIWFVINLQRIPHKLFEGLSQQKPRKTRRKR